MSVTPACAKPHTPVDRRPRMTTGRSWVRSVLATAGGHGGRPPQGGVGNLPGRDLDGSTETERGLPSDVQTVAALAVVDSGSTASTSRTTGAGDAATAQTTANTVVRYQTLPSAASQGMLGSATAATRRTVEDEDPGGVEPGYMTENRRTVGRSTARLMTEVGTSSGRGEVGGEHSEHERDDSWSVGLRHQRRRRSRRPAPALWGTSANRRCLPAALPLKLQSGSVRGSNDAPRPPGRSAWSCGTRTRRGGDQRFPTSALRLPWLRHRRATRCRRAVPSETEGTRRLPTPGWYIG